MTILYISKGVYKVSSQDIIDTLGADWGGNIRWFSGTAFYGELDHANTGNRVYTFPNASGTIAILSLSQTWSAQQQFNGNIIFNGGMQINVDSFGSTHTVLAQEAYIRITNNAGNILMRLPAISGSNEGEVHEFYKTQAGGTGIITPNGTDTIDGAASLTMNTQYQYVRVVSDGIGNWMISN